MQTWDRTWTDEELYEKYGITEDEIAFIESMIRPMELDRMTRPIEELLPEKPEARLRIYAYSIDDDAPRRACSRSGRPRAT